MAEDPTSQAPSPDFDVHINEEVYKKHGPIHHEIINCIRELPACKRSIVRIALSWIACAKRPLAKNELSDVLDIHKRLVGHSSDCSVEIDLILSTISELIQTHEDFISLRTFGSKERWETKIWLVKTISFKHDVAQYFLETWESWFPDAHMRMATSCIVYMYYGDCQCANPHTDRYKFYKYASEYWGYHAKIQPVGTSLILDFLESDKRLSTCAKDLPFKDSCGCCEILRPKRISKLHILVFFDLEYVIKPLLESGFEVDVKDDEDRTPLSWAIELGHSSIARYLLDQGANPNVQERVQTPLIWSVINGSFELFDMLVEYGAEYGNDSAASKRMLMVAAEKGRVEFFQRRFLEKNMDFNIRCQDNGRSPISRAAECGRENMVEFLLSQGADVNSRDIDGETENEKNKGKTPLTWAMLEGCWSIVDLLKQHGAHPVPAPVNPEALTDAAHAGKYESVMRFLENKVSPDFHTKTRGRSPLSRAAESGHDDVVRLLLDRGANPNLKDTNGRDLGIILEVINGEDQDKTNEGKTPLMWACMNSYKSTAKILLERGADPNLQDKYGKTALSWAPAMRHRKDLIDRHDHHEITHLLLDMGAAREPSAKTFEISDFKKPSIYMPLPDRSIRLLSFIEASNVEEGISQKTPLINCSLDVVNLDDNPHYEALSYTWAPPFPENTAEADEYQGQGNGSPQIGVNGHLFKITKNLHDFMQQEYSKEKSVDVRLAPHNKTALIQAAEDGKSSVVQLYLCAGANTEVQDMFGKTALHYAVQERHLGVLKLLVKAGADPQKLDNTGKSPLTYAKENQQFSKAKMVHILGKNMDSHRSTTIRRVSPRRFWIDAICINQANQAEKSSQVGMMSQIYRKAASVLVWLGVADKFTQYAAGSLKFHSSPAHEWAGLKRQPGANTLDYENVSDQCRGILHLMNRTWFQRVWVLQEVALASHIQIYCGKHQFDYVDIFMLLQCCLFHDHLRQQRFFNPDVRYEMGGSEAYNVTDIRLRTNPNATERNLMEELMWKYGQQLAPSWQRAPSLPLLLSRVWTMKATDPRDKIFALLGISREQPIFADYSKSICDIFTSVAWSFIKGAPDETVQFWQTGDIGKLEYLEGLSYVQRLPISHDSRSNEPYQLPSWVPDFNVPLFANRLWSPRFKSGITSSGPPHDLQFLDPHALELSGMLVDEVTEMDATNSNPRRIAVNPRRWLDMIGKMPPVYMTGKNRTEALCLTVMAHATSPSSGEEPDDALRLCFRHFIKRGLSICMNMPEVFENLRQLRETDPSDFLPSEKEIAEFLTALEPIEKDNNGDYRMTMSASNKVDVGISYYYLGRCLFRTQKEYLGLGPYSTRPGDEIWVIPGGRTPYILRPLSAGSSQRKFIGECYVHGIMDGELMSKEDKLEWQSVVLV